MSESKANEEMQILKDQLRASMMKQDLNDPILLMERIYALWRNWADFHLYITYPEIPSISPPIIHLPEIIPGTDEKEFVYPIHDTGYKLSTSKAENMFNAGQSMCKLFYTIEKMIFLLIERIKSSGMEEEEIQVNFAGHVIAQRKAFESIINLKYNVVVNNFEPGTWGDSFLSIVRNLANKGYGFPSETPRDIYRVNRGSRAPKIR